jgi:hypothetical protein
MQKYHCSPSLSPSAAPSSPPFPLPRQLPSSPSPPVFPLLSSRSCSAPPDHVLRSPRPDPDALSPARDGPGPRREKASGQRSTAARGSFAVEEGGATASSLLGPRSRVARGSFAVEEGGATASSLLGPRSRVARRRLHGGAGGRRGAAAWRRWAAPALLAAAGEDRSSLLRRTCSPAVFLPAASSNAFEFCISSLLQRQFAFPFASSVGSFSSDAQ